MTGTPNHEGGPERHGTAGLAPDRLDRPFNDPLFERLFPPLPAGVHWGLERVESALADLGDPHLGIPAIHIGGTNGKGSVASTLASVLGAAGRRVGLYTSPHLCSVRERFQVGGRPIDEDRLIELAGEIRTAVVTHGLTFFEASTVLAFHAFRAEGAEVQVIEVGLGGRLDATNVVHPLVSVLTNVAMDHSDFLGDTLTAIAGEKAGILKPGVPAVTAERGAEAFAVFETRAAEVGAPLYRIPPVGHDDLVIDESHTGFRVSTRHWGVLDVVTPLVGHHQASNAALAIAALARLPDELRPDREALLAGLASVRWPGRDQIEHLDDGVWLLDVAHNTAGVESLCAVIDGVDELPEPRVALVGVLGDKEWDEMLPPLLSRVRAAVLTQPPSAPELRRWDPEEAGRVARTICPGTPVEVIADFEAALATARELAGQGTVVVTGSCHTVGDALTALGRVPFV